MCLCLYMKYMKFDNYDIYERHLLWLCFFYMKDETIKYIIMVIINRYLLWLCLYIELYILITFFFFFWESIFLSLNWGFNIFFFLFSFLRNKHTQGSGNIVLTKVLKTGPDRPIQLVELGIGGQFGLGKMAKIRVKSVKNREPEANLILPLVWLLKHWF